MNTDIAYKAKIASLEPSIKEYYMATGCTVADLQAKFGIDEYTADKMINKALSEFAGAKKHPTASS